MIFLAFKPTSWKAMEKHHTLFISPSNVSYTKKFVLCNFKREAKNKNQKYNGGMRFLFVSFLYALFTFLDQTLLWKNNKITVHFVTLNTSI